MKIWITVILFSFFSCSGSRRLQSRSIELFNQVNAGNERVVISYSNNRNELYRILVYKDKLLLKHIEVRYSPEVAVIDKLILTGKGQNSVLMMVSDTVNNQLKCLDFQFLPAYSNAATLSTFTPLEKEDRQLFELLVKVNSKNGASGKYMTQQDVNRLLGWVVVRY